MVSLKDYIRLVKPLTVTGDGEQRRDFTYVGDIVDGLWRCGKSLYDTGDRWLFQERFSSWVMEKIILF